MEQGGESKNYEALTLGQRAGQLGLGAGLNPYQVGTGEYADWERARFTTLGDAMARRAA